MIEKEELLDQLTQFNYFVIERATNSPDKKERCVIQTSVFNKVKSHWNGAAIKFWDNKNEDNKLYLNSNIKIESEWNGDTLILHIVECVDIFDIMCYNK